MSSFFEYIERFFTSVRLMFQSIPGFIVVLISSFVALSSITKALIALTVMFLLDFLSGCFASWIEHKNSEEKAQVYFIESAKIRLSLVKLGAYFIIIIAGWILTELFFNETTGLVLSNKQFTYLELIVGLCIAAESWSNLENFKRAGFDIVGLLTKMAKQLWSLFRIVKTGKDHGNENN